MKKAKIFLSFITLFLLTGCLKKDSMESISITTSVYPIEYVVNYLYNDYSEINSIYPKDSEIIDFEITETLLDQYSQNDLFIFNGQSSEKNFIKYLRESNEDLKIIDVASNIEYKYSIEELWLDPNNLLTIANNIRKGFNEYITNTYLTNKIDENYENLKIELTKIDGNYYSYLKQAPYNYIIITDDAFKFLEKYGVKVLSLDKDTVTSKTISEINNLLQNKQCIYIFKKYKEEISDDIKEQIVVPYETLDLYTMTNLKDVNIDKIDYTFLINQNLENIKLELYK